MVTQYVTMAEHHLDSQLLEQAGKIIKDGGLVAFPTETVYGLGGDALQAASSEKIYRAKGRPSDNPLIIHIAKQSDLRAIVKEIPEYAVKLAQIFWPGPLTMIFHKSDIVPLETTGGLQTVAVRMPEDKIALAFIKEAGGYVAAPSANLSGRPSPTTAAHVLEDMDSRIDMIIDGGEACIGLESTIIDVTQEIPIILRPGFISKKMLEEVLQQPVEVDAGILETESDVKPRAPGMKYKHYAPRGSLTLIEGDEKAVIEEINARADEQIMAGQKVGIIAAKETALCYRKGIVKVLGRRDEEETIAHRLYSVLRELDEEQVTVIFSEMFDTQKMGQAIMNRLLKAAGHQIIHVNKKTEERK